jgi:Holliday junction resolvase-like predicted endonuclease
MDFSKAEIDIIAQKNTLAVVEVNSLLLEFGLPQDFVKPKKFNCF